MSLLPQNLQKTASASWPSAQQDGQAWVDFWDAGGVDHLDGDYAGRHSEYGVPEYHHD